MHHFGEGIVNNQQIGFVLDGFDEVRPIDRNNLIDWIKELVEMAKGCSFVVTSRPLTTDHLEKLGDGWLHWSLEPFDQPRIVSYISKWYANTPLLKDGNREIDATGLAQSWLGDPTIGPLTGNPLLLSTLLMVHHLDGKLPNGRANLYKRYVDGMLGIWDERHQLAATDIELNPTEKRKVIRGIALYLFLSEQETVDEDILLEWLTTFLPKINITESASAVLLVLRERSGLIVGPGIYSFAHKTIMEFLVAESTLQGDQQDQTGNRVDRFHLFEHRDDDRWNTVLFLWAGMAAFIDVNAFIEECIKDENWALAYGLLLDQYERFHLEARRKLLVKLKNQERPELWSDVTNAVSSGSPKDARLEIPISYFRLRELSQRSDFQIMSLIRKAILDNSITWEDFADTRGKVYELAWMLFLSVSKEPLKWQKVLESHVPVSLSKSKSKVKKLIAHWGLSSYAGLDHYTLKEFVLTYKNTFHRFGGYISLPLMSNLVAFVSRTSIDITSESEEIHQFFHQSIEILLEEDINKVIPFLSETRAWEIFGVFQVGNKFSHGDLLLMYLDAVDEISQKLGIPISVQKRNELKQFIDKLIELRDKQPNDSK